MFDESKHPRDSDGKFTDKEGGAKLSKDVRRKLKTSLAKYISRINGIKLPDETLPRSVGAKWHNFEISMPDGSKAKFVEGTKIQNKHAFAGYGTKTPIRDIERLNRDYKINSTKWQKIKGVAHIIDKGEEIKAEIHWYEEPSVGKVEIKFKREL